MTLVLTKDLYGQNLLHLDVYHYGTHSPGRNIAFIEETPHVSGPAGGATGQPGRQTMPDKKIYLQMCDYRLM